MAKRYFNVVEKNRKTFMVDLDGNVVPPEQARQLAHALISTTEAKAYVYVGQRQSDGLYKIGRTADLERRALELGLRFDHRIQCAFYGDQSSSRVESDLHTFFKATGQHVENEWFSLGDDGFSLITTYCHDATTALNFVADYLPAARTLTDLKTRCGIEVFSLIAAEFIEHKRTDRALWEMTIYYLKTLKKSLVHKDPYYAGYIDGVSNMLSSISVVRQDQVAPTIEALEASEREYKNQLPNEVE